MSSNADTSINLVSYARFLDSDCIDKCIPKIRLMLAESTYSILICDIFQTNT